MPTNSTKKVLTMPSWWRLADNTRKDTVWNLRITGLELQERLPLLPMLPLSSLNIYAKCFKWRNIQTVLLRITVDKLWFLTTWSHRNSWLSCSRMERTTRGSVVKVESRRLLKERQQIFRDSYTKRSWTGQKMWPVLEALLVWTSVRRPCLLFDLYSVF